jgi:SNF2 family DNA or RNA helicase
LSDGFIYFEGKTLRAEKNPKLEALKELVEGKNRIVIFAGFTESINLICEEMRKDSWEVIRIDGRGIDGDIERFMGTEGKIVIVAHPKSGGTGLNLTASDTIIYYSNDFDGESRMQSEDRIHRPGCKGANIIDLIHLPTDKYVAINLRNKKKLQAVTLADLKLNLEEQYEIR